MAGPVFPPAWLNAARHGYCERTGGKDDGTCSHDRKGSLSIASSAYADWQSAAKACLDACNACKPLRLEVGPSAGTSRRSSPLV